MAPRRRIEYRGVTLEEMDVDALLRRKPTVALVDELAHTNAPDSRNAKRYQDVEELLRAGINVITTVNIQHVESLYDMIEGFTGVKVKERVPDYILAEADQIVNVDVSSEDLQERLKAGKVYPAERVESALTHFFQEGNLSRLPELAFEEIAHLLDRRRQAAKADGPSSGAGRVMVCLSSRSPSPHLLLRKGARWPTECTPPGTPSTSARRPRTSPASTPPRSARSPTPRPCAQTRRGAHDLRHRQGLPGRRRGFRAGIRHHGRRAGAVAAAVVSDVARPVAARPAAAGRAPRRGRGHRGYGMIGRAVGAATVTERWNLTRSLPLVPKLRLGTPSAKLRFASGPERDAKQSFADLRSQTEFGNERESRRSPQ